MGVCGGCNLYLPHAACLVAFIASLLHLAISALVVLLRIDDPLDAVAVHGGGGLVGGWEGGGEAPGILSVPLFMPGGLWQGHSQAAIDMLSANAKGAAAIAGYNLVVSSLAMAMVTASDITPVVSRSGSLSLVSSALPAA